MFIGFWRYVSDMCVEKCHYVYIYLYFISNERQYRVPLIAIEVSCQLWGIAVNEKLQ